VSHQSPPHFQRNKPTHPPTLKNHTKGFDTRPYRLHRPGVKFFEIDLPGPSAAKQQLVDATLPDASAHPRPAYIAADLSRVSVERALEGSGFDRGQKSVFVAEGLHVSGWVGGFGFGW